MKKLFTLFLCGLLSAVAVFADEPFRNHRYDSFKVLETNNESIVFIGNSITDMHCWPEAFKTSDGQYLPIVNRGNSGTFSTEQSDNLESYLKGKPKKVFMMIGTNDIATRGLNFTGEQVLKYIKSMVDRIQKRSPETRIYLYCILKSDYGYRVESTWLHANELIKEYVEKTNSDKLKYVDIYDELACVADGGVWSYDKLHLTAAAYEIWCRSICQHLAEGENYTVNTVYHANTSSLQSNGGFGRTTHGMRATYFSMMPISNDDILVFGDEFIKNGEWQELLGNRNVKNRGTGWGYGGDIATTSKIVDATYASIEGVTKENAKAIFIYTGTGDCNGTTNIDTVKSNYKALVDKIVVKSPASKIYLMALCPTDNANNTTTRIAVLNNYMNAIASESESDNIKYVDTYTPFLNGNVAKTKYFYPSNYLGGLGYVVMANAMKDALKIDFPADTYTVISEAEAETRYAQANLRNSLSQVIARGLIAERGDAIGAYNATKMQDFDTEAENAYTLLAKESITETEVQEQTEKLNTVLREALSMPTASTTDAEHWYQFTSLRSTNLYISAEGEAAGIFGKADTGTSAVSMWKFVDRGDNTFDIINRKYGSYLNPVANYNAQITTVKEKPAKGWTVSYANTPGYYIISSGEVQLNQTGEAQSYKIYNWSNSANKGSDRNDTGCQLLIMDAAEITGPSLTLTPTEFDSSKSTWSYHGTTTSGGWYGKFVTNTTPALCAESTDANANNMGWTQKQPWLQDGYTYNFNLQGGYIITGYELTTKNGNTSGSSYACTFTYTTANGTATSSPQTSSESTIKVTGLETDAITLTLNGTTSDKTGLVITKLVVYYEQSETNEIVYTIDKTTGNLYHANGSANQNWNSTWKSNATPQLQFGCGTVNNMNWQGDNVQLMTGSAGSANYALTAPAGYAITEYSFTFANNGHDTGLSLTMEDGKGYTTSTNAQTISAKNIKANSVSFVLAGSNGKGVVLTNFTVKVKKETIDKPVISTTDNEHWYYITNASSKAYCGGKVIYYDNDMEKLRFADKTFSADRIWSFWEKDGKIAIKNYKGEYFGKAGNGTGGSTAFGVVSEPNYIYNIESAHGFFTIKDDAVELHAQESNSMIVRWAAEANGASLWRFDEVDVTNAAAEFTASNVVQGKVSTGIGNTNQPIVRSTIRISGLEGDVTFQGVKGAFAGSNKSDVTNVKAYFASNSRELFVDPEKKMTWREENGEQFGETVTLGEDGTFAITGSKILTPGDHYLWITYDIAETAKEGNTVDASITAYTIDDKEVAESNGNPNHSVTIFLSEGAVLMPMDKGSLYYRIPSITVTKDGKRLVTLTDDRKAHNSDLPSHCYLVAQYSEDNGKTWSDPVTVAGTAETGGDYGHGDASIVTNRDNGEIVGIMTSAGTYGHGYFAGTAAEPPRWKTITSRDGGLTWETPVDHTDDLFGANCSNPYTQTWKSGFSGSGAALQKRDGTLVSSFVNRQDDNSQHFYFFMSKDGGKSWYVSGTSGTSGADEPKTLERNNGDLAISVRASGYNYYNYTSDDGATWHNPSQTRFTTGISGNACDGEYMVWCSTVEGNPWNIAFQTLPNSGSRQNVSIALSTDEGATFGTPKTICPIGSAYSAAVVLPDGTLGVYYEENGVFGGFTMRFVRFSLDWASDGTYKFTEEAPFYPIKSTNPDASIEEITEQGADSNDIYDLQGRKVIVPAKGGIYIQNGQKFIAR